MIIYNVTNKVHHSIVDAWLEWVKTEHIPEMVATRCFTHATILHLLEADDEEGKTYAIQYHAPDISTYDNYIEKFSGSLRKKTITKWGDKFIAFRSLMEVVN